MRSGPSFDGEFDLKPIVAHETPDFRPVPILHEAHGVVASFERPARGSGGGPTTKRNPAAPLPLAQVARIADALEVGVKVHRDPVCDWCPPGYERARAVEARLTAIWVPPDPASTSYDPGKGGSGVVARLGAT